MFLLYFWQENFNEIMMLLAGAEQEGKNTSHEKNTSFSLGCFILLLTQNYG